MLTIETTLAIFLMLGISSLAVFWAKKIQVPHTVLLVLIGIFLGFLSILEPFSFFKEFHLTPELLFYLLLPTLIFESAFNMNMRKLVADGGAILSLAIGGFLVSTLIISGTLFGLLPLIGINVSFELCLLFGALISATDPVAVLTLFKEYGVPRRLSLIFEGESLFNDATAVALFLVTLEAINQGGFSLFSTITGSLTFISMLLCGIIFGLLAGGFFTILIGKARDNEIANITLTIVLAHITFIVAELLNETTFFGISIPISPIISTTIASLLIGNYGRVKINPKAERFVSHLWEQFAFMANSLIFILIGILIIEMPIFNPLALAAIGITIIVVATARAISIYPVIGLYNHFQPERRKVPLSWQHLMAWGSLRGALAVTMVFLIPDDLTITGWNFSSSPKEFLLAITIGCIAATLLIKATTIRSLVSKLKLGSLTQLEEVEYQEARALMHHKVTTQLKRYLERGYIDTDIAERLLKEHREAFTTACGTVASLSDKLTLRVLRLYAIGIEKRHLKLLFAQNEVTEPVFRRIWGKLQIQLESIEHGDLSPDMTISADSLDVFEHLANKVKTKILRRPEGYSFNERYMYYRAQSIISRKVLKEFDLLKKDSSTIFTSAAVEHVTELYEDFRKCSKDKLIKLSSTSPVEARELAEKLAEHSVHTVEEVILNDIYEKELITQKLYITLQEELKLK